MIIIHGMNDPLRLRHAESTLVQRLRTMPAVVLGGARQAGKSTLAGTLPGSGRQAKTLDDLDVLDRARHDPAGLVSGPGPLTLEEVQREPTLLLAIQDAIDRDRRAGRFLLTGSADVRLMKGVGDPLAGRASHLTLWPLTRREQLGLGRCGLWEELVTSRKGRWMDLVMATGAGPEDWRELARRGGFPAPALHLTTSAERGAWFEGYARTYLERDLQVLSSISALPGFRRLMRAACLRSGQLVNQAELARNVALPQPTVHRYLNLLETSYLLVRLPAYSVNRTKRLLKSPRLYWGDVGLSLHLAGQAEPTAAHLENLALLDLLAWRDARSEQAGIFYWRTTTGEEVDFVIEAEGRVLPIEVKATARPDLSDAVHLRSFRSEYGKPARAGILIHDGTATEWLSSDVLAVPWWRIF